MNKVVYDGSLEGLLTALFEVVEYRFHPVEIVGEAEYVEDLFSDRHNVITQQDKAKRIMDFFEKKLSREGVDVVLKIYLSEHPKRNQLLLDLLNKCIHSKEEKVLNNLADESILEISKIVRSVNRESHRMKAFVRFQRMANEYYYAEIEPDFDVLPLIKKFFTQRYADQFWMIYDVRRQYAISYDKKESFFLYLDKHQLQELSKLKNDLHESEQHYQVLWQRYFDKTNITERKNLKLHTQQLPKRYWKYLTEKSKR